MEEGVSTPSLEEALLNQIMIQQADKVIAVFDSSKFNKRSYVHVGNVDEIDCIITDRAIPVGMTGKLKARFSGGEFDCVDDIEKGTHITAVVRPEDVELVKPELGTIQGVVDSVIFKGMHYEIAVLSGKNEIVSQTVHSAKSGDRVGIRVEPDNIHIMIAEDHTNLFFAEINKDYRLEYNGHVLDTSLTKIIKGSSRREDGTLQDASGEAIDPNRIRIQVAIGPSDIEMTDDQEAGLIQGTISNLIYKGDHYSYIIHTDVEQDFVVNDEYLWNMGDRVGLMMPVDKMKFTLKKK
jgi:spermidine/putrescine transport system ATP-binding protein